MSIYLYVIVRGIVMIFLSELSKDDETKVTWQLGTVSMI